MSEKQLTAIGPESPIAGLIQLVVIGTIGFLALVQFMPIEFIVLKLLPTSLVYLVVLGHLALLGDNYPFAPPAGSWTPDKSRLTAGVGMVIIWAFFSVATLQFMINVFPKWPVSPLYLWFGAIVFAFTVLYGINWNGWPFKGVVHPAVMVFISAILIVSLSSLVWIFLTNLDGTPFADSPMNHHGPLNVQWLTGYLVWFIACFFILNPVFTTQGWPFHALGHPGAALAQTVTALALSYLFWVGSLKLGMSPSFSFGALASSIITWAVIYCWHLQFWGITRFTNGTRAILAILVVLALTGVWLLVTKALLAPAAAAVSAANLPADINVLTIYYNLCVLAPLMIAHNAFSLRWPLTLPAPPGTPAPDESV